MFYLIITTGAELYSASSGKKDENPVIEFKTSPSILVQPVLHNIDLNIAQGEVVDLNIAQGEVVVIIRPSGSGKSTLLRCINKLEEITSGDLIVDGLKVNDPKVDERLIRRGSGYGVPAVLPLPASDGAGKRHVWPLRVRGANKRGGKNWRVSCWRKSVWQSVHITTLPNFLVVNSSVWRLPARWR